MIRAPKCLIAIRSTSAVLLAASMTLFSYGCSGTATNTNANLNSNTSASLNTNANSNTAATSAPFTTREPEAYSLSMTISGQGTANDRQGAISPQPIEFAKRGADRRWSIQIPQPVGQVTYMEKAGLKYLILPARNQYVELAPQDLGFNIGSAMTPTAMVDQLRPRTQHENLGTETINGRLSTKFRFAGATDTRTQAGTVQADSLVYIDEATGIPLRADLNLTSTSGATGRVALETRDIQLNPDPQLFEVPAGMKKVTAAELKQQVQGFIAFLKVLVPMLGQQMGAQAPAAQPATNTNANRTGANSNGSAATPNANRP